MYEKYVDSEIKKVKVEIYTMMSKGIEAMSEDNKKVINTLFVIGFISVISFFMCFYSVVFK